MNIIDNAVLKEKFIEQFHIGDCFDSVSDLNFELVGFSKDEYLIKEGEETDCLFFILVGRVKCYSCSKKHDFGIFYMTKGMIGDSEYVTGRAAVRTVTALQETLCLRFNFSKYRHILMKDIHFLTYLNQQLAEKLTLAEMTPQDLGESLSAEERLFEYLKLTSDDGKVGQSLGQISQAFGISYRHLIRMMNTLCDQGMIRHGKNKGVYFINQKQ